ncbi:hypothetical protein JVT61DRAFT_11322 [Boletus reticuloceps]|uniref:Uncharacterized protein n=1 Tax=Boletus reticuloceps TaxID=495285 RepID=A0A8I2YEQ6_9AGAM|nr:hypothetical protein JVT61DRAFT_11322 [Boletus reticuloceps]
MVPHRHRIHQPPSRSKIEDQRFFVACKQYKFDYLVISPGVNIIFSRSAQNLTMAKVGIRTRGPFTAEDAVLPAAYASRTENQIAIDNTR